MTDKVLRLRQTWPEEPNIFSVLNENDDRIGQVARQDHMSSGVPRWAWTLQAFNYRARPDFAGRCDSRKKAMAELKSRWPDYRAEMEYDGWLESVRRERLGVPTRMFVYQDQYETAPAQIEALAGCLEGTVEEARLSLLCQAMEFHGARQYHLQTRVVCIDKAY